MTSVVILGAGGFAREVLDVFDACEDAEPGRFRVLGFVSEIADDWGKTLNGRPVLGGFEWFEGDRAGDRPAVLCAIGNPAVRQRVMERALGMGLRPLTVIHPRATRTRWVDIGDGTIVTAGTVMTSQIRLGRHVQLHVNATIGHDTTIEDFVTVLPGANVSGNVHVGTGCEIGAGAVIIQNVTIGAWSIVGAGAVVIRDLPPNCTAVGVPAKVITMRPSGWWASG